MSKRIARSPIITATEILTPVDWVAANVPPIKSATGIAITTRSPRATRKNTTM
jgi:hypothetical protein